MKILFFVSIILVAIFIAPTLLVWSLNTLFPVLAIPYNFQTLVAALIVLLLLVPTKVKS